MQLLISIKTLSPLYVGALKPYGSFLETHAEIPGSILRGAVAQRALPDCVAPELINDHEACIVKEICPFYYLTTVVAFPTCAVAEGGHRAELPLRTMVTCKAAPGFASQSTTREPKHWLSGSACSGRGLHLSRLRHYSHHLHAKGTAI